ncbi:polymerase [Ahniella affigens]|uniref:Polymerase n=1 Tax=Ahniella affigens TaxID=2021234 RepID=A0A2P1PS65_9GAMM|nr:O-antigen ligase family protein [Ahniella affigens]AVP97681.1 polymerase [Ahniella affigens]
MNVRVLLLLSVLALLPFGRASELPILIGALIGMADLIKNPTSFRTDTLLTVILIAFLGYWLPEFVSAFDSQVAMKSWSEAALDLRYLSFLWFCRESLRSAEARAQLRVGFATLTGILVLDALVQASVGTSLGGPLQADRLSGLFGENLKLGPVLAAIFPFLVLPALERYGRAAASLAWLLAAVVVLLAGARAGWISFGLTTILLLRDVVVSRRAYLLSLLGLALLGMGSAATLYAVSPSFAERVHRTARAFDGSEAAIDHALAFRLPIWRAALGMMEAHPVNGVGVRAFRYAYADYAGKDDRWLTDGDDVGAFHAHQIVLEIGSETGLIGLLIWLVATILLIAKSRQLADAPKHDRRPAALALISMLFPINTHFAVYSSFWGTLLILMLACWLAQLARPDRD